MHYLTSLPKIFANYFEANNQILHHNTVIKQEGQISLKIKKSWAWEILKVRNRQELIRQIDIVLKFSINAPAMLC